MGRNFTCPSKIDSILNKFGVHSININNHSSINDPTIIVIPWSYDWDDMVFLFCKRLAKLLAQSRNKNIKKAYFTWVLKRAKQDGIISHDNTDHCIALNKINTLY